MIATELATADEVSEEVHPGNASHGAVDLSAIDTYVEFKRRTGFPQPEREWVEQLDRHLEASREAGRGVRMGVLTDGRHWLLRWPGTGRCAPSNRTRFALERAEDWSML